MSASKIISKVITIAAVVLIYLYWIIRVALEMLFEWLSVQVDTAVHSTAFWGTATASILLTIAIRYRMRHS